MIKTKNIIALAIAFAMIAMVGANAVTAETQSVEVTWIIPGDTTFSLEFPDGETEIVFDTGAQTFSNKDSRGQTNTIPALNISNTGNTDIDIAMEFLDALQTNVTFVNCSVGTNHTVGSGDFYFWTSANATSSNQTVTTSLSPAGQASYWFTSSGVNVSESAEGADKSTLQIVSTKS